MKRIAIVACLAAVFGLMPRGESLAQSAAPRSAVQQEYAQTVWDYIQRNSYKTWSSEPTPVAFEFGPPVQLGISYVNGVARASHSNDGAVIVTEHYDAKNNLVGVTAWRKSFHGYSPQNDDWYWSHYTPEGQAVKTSADSLHHDQRGFVTMEDDGRLWVFDINSPELADYLAAGELAKHTIQPGAGPGGMTLKAPDTETIIRYVTAKPGFHTFVREERLWVFPQWSGELQPFLQTGELAKHTIRPSAGPLGMTIKAPDAETIENYLYFKPGFTVLTEDGRLWVFKSDSKELAEFRESGELAKRVTRVGAGPKGMTLLSPDSETIAAYLAAVDGFTIIVGDDGRLWVFREGAPEHQDFLAAGELAKHVIRPGAGPDGMTVRAPDDATISEYLQEIGL